MFFTSVSMKLSLRRTASTPARSRAGWVGWLTSPASQTLLVAWAACLMVSPDAHSQNATTPSSLPAVASTPPNQRLSLSELTRAVVANNPAFLAAQQARNTAAASVITAGALPNPRLEVQDGNNTARLPASIAGRVQGMGVSQLIENSTLRQARVEGARAFEAGALYQTAITRNELVAQVQLRAYEYLLRRAEAGAATEALALLEQVRERVRLRVESGEAARYEIIKADAEIISARQRQQSSTLQAEQSLLSLNRLAAGQLPAQWTLDASLNDPVSLTDLAQLQAQALADNPELKALQAELDRAGAQVRVARASRWPGVELRYNQVREPEITHSTVGLSVQVPLFDQRQGPMAEASSELERQRTRLSGRQAELQQQILLAWKSLEMARLKVQALSQGAVRESEAALRVAQAAYRFGERGILDVLDAQRVLRSVRADLLVASYEVQAARIELEFLAGRYAAPL
jgi:cobalt-zinc-cadmium efflux system outer membrane protein